MDFAVFLKRVHLTFVHGLTDFIKDAFTFSELSSCLVSQPALQVVFVIKAPAALFQSMSCNQQSIWQSSSYRKVRHCPAFRMPRRCIPWRVLSAPPPSFGSPVQFLFPASKVVRLYGDNHKITCCNPVDSCHI